MLINVPSDDFDEWCRNQGWAISSRLIPDNWIDSYKHPKGVVFSVLWSDRDDYVELTVKADGTAIEIMNLIAQFVERILADPGI